LLGSIPCKLLSINSIIRIQDSYGIRENQKIPIRVCVCVTGARSLAEPEFILDPQSPSHKPMKTQGLEDGGWLGRHRLLVSLLQHYTYTTHEDKANALHVN
jgi:hypothetical protein